MELQVVASVFTVTTFISGQLASVSKHGAQRPQKPQGLLGTGRRGEGGTEVGREGDYTPIATLSPLE